MGGGGTLGFLNDKSAIGLIIPYRRRVHPLFPVLKRTTFLDQTIFFATGNYRSALRNVELGVIMSKNHLRDKFPRMRDESVTLHHFGYLLTVAVAAGERKTRANKARNGLHRVYLVLNLSRKIMQTIDTYEVMVIIAEQ